MKYLKIKEEIRQIINWKLMLGDQENLKLPSEESLAKQLNTSRVTVREGLRSLENEGLIIRKHGVGTFINNSDNRFSSGMEKITDITNIIKKRGFTPNIYDITIAEIEYEEELEEVFSLENRKVANKDFIKIERCLAADEIPIAFYTDYLLKERLKQNRKITKEKLSGSLLNLLESEHNIFVVKAKVKLSPVKIDRFLSEKLKLPKNSLLLKTRQYNYDNENNFIFFTEAYFSSDRFEFRFLKSREKKKN